LIEAQRRDDGVVLQIAVSERVTQIEVRGRVAPGRGHDADPAAGEGTRAEQVVGVAARKAGVEQHGDAHVFSLGDVHLEARGHVTKAGRGTGGGGESREHRVVDVPREEVRVGEAPQRQDVRYAASLHARVHHRDVDGEIHTVHQPIAYHERRHDQAHVEGDVDGDDEIG